MDNLALKNFYKQFPNEQACVAYLEQLRWPKGRICPRCGSTKIYQFKDGQRCKCGDCKRQFTAKVGTIFADSHITLQDWFLAIIILTAANKGVSSIQLAKELGITQKSAWLLIQRLRSVTGCRISGPVEPVPVRRHKPYKITGTLENIIKKSITLPTSPKT